MQGYVAKELRPNDYIFINSMIVAVVSLLFLTIALYVRWNDSFGFIICFPISYLAVTMIVGASVVEQSRSFTKGEVVLWSVMNIAYILIGVFYFIYRFDLSDFTFNVDERNPAMELASYFILLYILMVPTLVHGIFVAVRIVDRGFQDFSILYKAFLGLFAFGVVLMTLCIFLFVHWLEGLIMLCALLAIIWGIVQGYLYVKNDFFMKPLFQTINFILAFLGVIAASVVSMFKEDMNGFQGVSFSMMALLLVFWGYALMQFAIDIVQISSRPVFYSSGLFPIYKYNPVKKDIEAHYTPTVAYCLGLVTLIVWTFFSAFSLTPTWFGVIMSVGIQELLLISVLYLTSLTRANILSIADFMSPDLTKKAWLMTKKTYVQNKTALERSELLSYKKMWVRRFYLDNLIKAMQNFPLRSPYPENAALFSEFEESKSNPKEYYLAKVKEFMNPEFDCTDLSDLSTAHFDLCEKVHEAYIEELEQIVQFVMIQVQTVTTEQEKVKKEFFAFINDKKEVLHALGLSI